MFIRCNPIKASDVLPLLLTFSAVPRKSLLPFFVMFPAFAQSASIRGGFALVQDFVAVVLVICWLDVLSRFLGLVALVLCAC